MYLDGCEKSCRKNNDGGYSGSVLRHTFLHLPRIGLRTEQNLWREGIRTWDDLETAHSKQMELFGRATSPLLDAIVASREALEAQDAAFFAERLPPREHYRIAAEFPSETVFLDIETTGLSLYYDTITLIGCAIGDRYGCHIVGTGEDDRNTVNDLIREGKCLVTFNGTLFDLKFLAKYEPGFRLPAAHVDLRYLVRRVSLTGGQKEVEEALGLKRPEEVTDVDGARAVMLWYEYVSGNVESGKQLVRYNHADVEGMKVILDHVMAKIWGATEWNANSGAETGFATKASSIRFGESASGVHVPTFSNDTELAMSYELLSKDIPDGLRVIGIDLTGAEARPSGWCELSGAVASTRMIDSDEAIIESITSFAPHLVSIDSPLSLPSGRRDVSDDDPTRDEFGIMRLCERTLKRRGINVYPCLIPSMQRLTARGIRLAKALRERGIPVIESYPGAAQDIMNIPRKAAGIEHLKRGLQLFGITGDYLHTQVTHDELDAITSAIVGVYFWAGRFEALGDIDEDYLIVPDLKRTVRRSRVIGISGPIAAGKTTAARLLERDGFKYGRYSEVLIDLAAQRGRRPDRATLQQLGHIVHRDPGQRWLNNRLLSRMYMDDIDMVIDGLRWPEDHVFWVERFGPSFLHVHISTSPELRRARYPNGGGTMAEFDTVSKHEVESGVAELKALADIVVGNDQTIDHMQRVLAKSIDKRFAEENL